MVNSGVEYVIMEMSAHALFHQKNWGVMSDIAVFTNLTQDHLDFFSNMENYGKAKKQLFSKNQSKYAVINIDDEYSKIIIDGIDIPYVTVGKNREALIRAEDIESGLVSQNFVVDCFGNKFKASINLGGVFNISNALGAIAVCKLLGVDNENIKDGLENLKMVDGRFCTSVINGKTIVIDYAHTPDGLSNILNAVKQVLKYENSRIISVFGCGGNRDKTKRPIMGQISSMLADVTIVTSDNPRFESPNDIINDILKGVKDNSSVIVEPDRKQAIKKAYEIAEVGDVIVLSGKGAEDYMDIMGKKIHYSDFEEIEKIGG